jgi:ubiquinone/menaquinone biosynthesis C-methylase UbiE
MSVHSPLAHLFPPAKRHAPTRGHTLGAPRAYDTFANFFFLGRRRVTYQSLIAAAGATSGQRVLDVGCGTGYLARLLAEAVGSHGLVIGVDASEEMIDYANHQPGRQQHCQFQLGTAESLSFASAHFDVVVSSLFMHHLPAELQQTAVAEMERVLLPGGTLLIAEAQVPRGFGWRMLARAHGYDRMAAAVQGLEHMIGDLGFEDISAGEAPPLLRYVRAVKSSTTRTRSSS